ncbi:MAG: ribonuclease J [Desulfobacterales bacterium]|nr:ribonuclease J [Desulfobacterales bacterium]
MLKIIPLGGLGEIGLNMMVFEYGDTLFVIDAGLMFPEDYMLGIDIVIPNFDYIRRHKHKLSGIVLTHAHEDHIGALPYLLREINAPVFGTPFTLGIVKHKLEEHGVLSTSSLHEISPQEKLRFGIFELEFIRVCHSIVGGVGLAIKTPFGLIVHTGDFKISQTPIDGLMTDVNRFAQCGEEGVLLLMSDSTNVEREGYAISDQEVGETLSKIIEQGEGRVIVALFASNISRIQQIIDIAKAKDRKILFDGKSIKTNVRIAKDFGYISIPKGTEIDLKQINDFPDDEIVIITTGSQGEPMSSLSRMASGRHIRLTIKRGDTVVLSSKFIPGNEKAIAKIINSLYRQGADVIYEKISDIHVSGHAFQEGLKQMINLTKPKYFVPIHGELRHLILHARLAEQSGVSKERILFAENGHIIEFDENGGRVREKVVTGHVLIDGKGIGDVGWSVLKERRILSEDGIVAVTMAFDEETGIVVYGPDVVSRGFIFGTETGHLLEDAKCVILEIIEEVEPETPDRIDKIRSRVRSDLRKYFYFTIKRHPVIFPFIIEI